MRTEIEQWLKKAERDFSDARFVFAGKRFSLTAFLCQQSVEKALKALFLFEKKEDIPKSHSLIYLAKQTTIPKKYHPFLRELTPAFIDTRYPDTGVDGIEDSYDMYDVQRMLEKSKEVLGWIKKQLSTHSSKK